MVEWFVHDRLYRILDIELEFTAKTSFRIGAGREVVPSSPIDLQVLRIRMGELDAPYIPGSSLKGVFRSTAEYIAKSSGISNVCMAGEGCRRNYNKQLEIAVRNYNINEIKRILNNYCLICKLYGSGSFASHITFSDAYPKRDIPVGVKTGIAIDRRSGTVKRRALFTVEFVQPGAKFYGKISLKNNPNYAVGLLAYILDLINSGLIKIGGFKSRGFGTFNIKTTNISGLIFSDEGVRNLMDLNVLEPLDEMDEKVDISDVKGDYSKFLERFKMVWDSYVRKVTKK